MRAAALLVIALAAIAPVAHAEPEGSVRLAESPADRVVGSWKPSDRDEIVIAIAQDGDHYTGKVAKSPTQPDAVGKSMIRGLKYDAGTGKWLGEFYVPKRSEFVPIEITYKDATTFVMTVGKGSMFAKDVTWVRV